MRRNNKTEEELWLAVRSLAWQSENIKKRLSVSYDNHLIYVLADDMPTETLKKKLSKVHKRLTTKQDKLVPVSEAIYYWSYQSCRTIIQNICDIYDEYIHFEWSRDIEKSILESLVKNTAVK